MYSTVFEDFKNYFLASLDEVSENVAQTVRGLVEPLDYDNFVCIVNSLTENERYVLTHPSEIPTGSTEELRQFMIYNKTLYRYWDAMNGRTDMTDDGILMITPDSTVLELEISMGTFLELRNLGAYAIKDVVDVMNTLSLEASSDIGLAAMEMSDREDIIYVKEGLHAV